MVHTGWSGAQSVWRVGPLRGAGAHGGCQLSSPSPGISRNPLLSLGTPVPSGKNFIMKNFRHPEKQRELFITVSVLYPMGRVSSCEANPRCSIFPGPCSRALGIQMCVCGSFVNCRAVPGEPRGLPLSRRVRVGEGEPVCGPGTGSVQSQNHRWEMRDRLSCRNTRVIENSQGSESLPFRHYSERSTPLKNQLIAFP